jgi:hypothetical protein
MDTPTMIIGIDVAHWVGKKKESVIGFAASMDRYISRYYIDSAAKVMQDKRTPSDMTFELEPLFQAAILKFTEQNGTAPLRIIIYRDSVSEG